MTETFASHNDAVPVRLVIKLARQYYPSLPAHVQAHLDLEDFIQMGVLRVLQCLPKHDPSRGARTTFAHHVVRSWYLEIVRSYKRMKHPQQAFVALDVPAALAVGYRPDLERIALAEARVERFLSLASPDLLALLRTYLFQPSKDFRRWTRSLESTYRGELSRLIRLTGVQIDDFRYVLIAGLRDA